MKLERICVAALLTGTLAARVAMAQRARTMRFMLHGSYCGGFGGELCAKQRTITGRSFEFRQPK